MEIFDTHAHYDCKEYNEDRDSILTSMPKNGVKYIINQGIDVDSSKVSLTLANKYPHVYAAVGIQPDGVHKLESIDTIRDLAKHPKVVAIGEIGLEYHYDVAPKEHQIEYFKKQIELANELKLPIVVHNREAHSDTLRILKKIPAEKSGSIHCFSGSVEMAKELIKMGYYLGFDGPITFKNARVAVEVLEYVPLDRILVETDAPFLTPVPFRGTRNNSMYLEYVIKKIAEIKKQEPEAVAKIIFDNAKRLFSIDN